MKKKITAVLAATGMVLLAWLTLPNQASATEAVPVCVEVQLRSAAGEYPEVDFIDTPAGASYTEDTATLIKPTEGILPGTEFVALKVDLEFDSSVSLTVDYDLVDGASSAAGAVRVFYYEEQDADTLFDGPKDKAIADGTSGTLTIPGIDKVGTFGFTYDGSNLAGGKAVFSNLKIGDMKPVFKADCAPPTTAPATTAPSTQAPTTAAPAPTAVRTTPAGTAAELPVTGSKTLGVLCVAGVLIVGGAGLWWLSTRLGRGRSTRR